MIICILYRMVSKNVKYGLRNIISLVLSGYLSIGAAKPLDVCNQLKVFESDNSMEEIVKDINSTNCECVCRGVSVMSRIEHDGSRYYVDTHFQGSIQGEDFEYNVRLSNRPYMGKHAHFELKSQRNGEGLNVKGYIWTDHTLFIKSGNWKGKAYHQGSSLGDTMEDSVITRCRDPPRFTEFEELSMNEVERVTMYICNKCPTQYKLARTFGK
jgi:hypothetical protein